jgi:hypothetical protein
MAMKIEKIKYTAHFEGGIIVAKWIGIEGISDPGETPDQTFQLITEQVEKWSQQGKPDNLAPGYQAPEGYRGPRMELPVINVANERLIAKIDDATTLDELRQFKDECKYPATLEAYVKRFNALNNG